MEPRLLDRGVVGDIDVADRERGAADEARGRAGVAGEPVDRRSAGRRGERPDVVVDAQEVLGIGEVERLAVAAEGQDAL